MTHILILKSSSVSSKVWIWSGFTFQFFIFLESFHFRFFPPWYGLTPLRSGFALLPPDSWLSWSYNDILGLSCPLVVLALHRVRQQANWWLACDAPLGLPTSLVSQLLKCHFRRRRLAIVYFFPTSFHDVFCPSLPAVSLVWNSFAFLLDFSIFK